MDFKQFLYEAAIEDFMSKVNSCQTLDGLSELEKYYKKRVKEADLKDSDDITIRDALAGKRTELESIDSDEEENF
ncbi:RNA-DNA + DNA-DNA helicase [Klebsiella phage AmPh_EK29]|uniref:RNA-DNA + DNA-DNA helicase n=1 Tax=Klebsiella phage AmPh_EK29 TaxID=2653641 RepID=A0A5P8PK94_9CAUD|nr:RNA-DNA + DNA-DNA helicase [Klebsiella phage AmPh_EK29]